MRVEENDCQINQMRKTAVDPTLRRFIPASHFLGILTLFAPGIAWTDPVPEKLDAKIVAYCTGMKVPAHRDYCLRSYSAKPWEYTVHTVPPGDGYTLCERFADNLRALVEPPTCEVRIAPKYADLFQTVEWEALDPKEYPELLYHTDAAISTPGEWKLRTGEESWPSYKAWRYRFEEKLKIEQSQNDPVERELSRAYFDANGDGQAEWMLGHRHKRPCNPWGEISYSYGYHYFPLKADRRTVDREIMRPNHEALELGFGSRPITTTIKDPRNPDTRTYLLSKNLGKPENRVTRRGQIEGMVFELYAATRWGLGQVNAHRVCTFELRQQTTAQSKK